MAQLNVLGLLKLIKKPQEEVFSAAQLILFYGSNESGNKNWIGRQEGIFQLFIIDTF
jgi:hypothetical protein